MNLTSTYLGLELRSPIVVSACPLSEDVANIVKMEDHGAGAVVLFSLFEEQIRRENALYQEVIQNTEGAFAEAADYFRGAEDYQSGTAEYLDLIRRAKERKRDYTVDWVHLKLNDQAQRTVLCKDPFKARDERVEKLIASL